MNKKPSISFFCPAYNDEENLPILIPKTIKLLKNICSSFEIVVIDDASPDNTGKIADELAKKFAPNIKVIHHLKNAGYGGALLSGLKHAKKYPYVFYTDGDNQYDVSVIKKMLQYINSYDAIVGCRESRSLNLKRKIQSSFYNRLLKTMFNINNDDVNCAIRLLKRDFINKIDLSSASAFLPAEMLIELNKYKAKIKNITVKHYPRIHGKASGGKLSVILPTMIDMLKYYVRGLINNLVQ